MVKKIAFVVMIGCLALLVLVMVISTAYLVYTATNIKGFLGCTMLFLLSLSLSAFFIILLKDFRWDFLD